MFHPEDLDRITRARLLPRFVLTLDYPEDASDAGDASRYAIIISNNKQFQLLVKYLADVISFHQVEQVMADKNSCSESGALDYVLMGL